jgi:hypothetical protein
MKKAMSVPAEGLGQSRGPHVLDDGRVVLANRHLGF